MYNQSNNCSDLSKIELTFDYKIPEIIFTPKLSNRFASNDAVERFLLTLTSRDPSNPAERHIRLNLNATSILSK